MGPLKRACAAGPSRKPAGILYIETHNERRRFTHEDLELFVCVSILAGQALEQATLFANAEYEFDSGAVICFDTVSTEI